MIAIPRIAGSTVAWIWKYAASWRRSSSSCSGAARSRPSIAGATASRATARW